jgi:hypothetical protein
LSTPERRLRLSEEVDPRRRFQELAGTMQLTSDNITIMVLLIGEASGVFASFNPSWFTVSSPFFHDQEAKQGNIKRIRWGETAATVIVVGTGWAIWKRTGDIIPLIASILIAALFVGGYEFMIAHPASAD